MITLLTILVNGNWLKAVVQNNQGTCCIKANAFDFGIVNALCHSLSSQTLLVNIVGKKSSHIYKGN